MKTFQYYTGDIALDCDPTPGDWDGDTFTAPDGSKWKPSSKDDQLIDGSGVHQLIPTI